MARMGEPTVRIAAEGITLPRPVRVIFGWQQGWRSYRVTLRPRRPAVRRRARGRRAQRQARAAARARCAATRTSSTAAWSPAASRPDGRGERPLAAPAPSPARRHRPRQQQRRPRSRRCARSTRCRTTAPGATSARRARQHLQRRSTYSSTMQRGDLGEVQEERRERDARQHAGARVEHEVAAEDARDRAAGADVGHVGGRCRSATGSGRPRSRRRGRTAGRRAAAWRPRPRCRRPTGTACCRSGAASCRA